MIQLVNDYSEYVDNLKNHIKDSKYKTTFFLEELGIPKASFYRKLRENTFSIEEVQKITKMLFPKEAYKQELLEAIDLGRSDIENGRLISSADMRSAMREKLEAYQ